MQRLLSSYTYTPVDITFLGRSIDNGRVLVDTPRNEVCSMWDNAANTVAVVFKHHLVDLDLEEYIQDLSSPFDGFGITGHTVECVGEVRVRMKVLGVVGLLIPSHPMNVPVIEIDLDPNERLDLDILIGKNYPDFRCVCSRIWHRDKAKYRVDRITKWFKNFGSSGTTLVNTEA